jgi:hypothetical protein
MNSKLNHQQENKPELVFFSIEPPNTDRVVLIVKIAGMLNVKALPLWG